jgi:tripartite-type tricarboxylate transporter receptor subunit TctC
MQNACRCLVGILPFVTATAVHAQSATDYPSRPLRMVVPFAPGGNSDFVGRIVALKLTQELGQQIVIDNRSGAGGNVGVTVAARANPDGYTLLLGNVGNIAINPSMYPDFPIRPQRDLIAVSIVADAPGALVAHTSIPSRTVKEFVAYAKTRPGKMDYGSSGAGSALRLEMESFMRTAGIQLTHIPYKAGAGGVATALLSGEVHATITSVSSVMPHVKTGRIKILGVATPARIPVLPDIPTMAESGFPEFVTGSWQGIFVPAGTPRIAVDRLHTTLTKIMADNDVANRFGTAGAVVMNSKSPQEAAVFVKEQTERWAKIIKIVGVTGE